MWFGGVMMYVRHSDSADELARKSDHPKIRVKKDHSENKKDKCKSKLYKDPP